MEAIIETTGKLFVAVAGFVLVIDIGVIVFWGIWKRLEEWALW